MNASGSLKNPSEQLKRRESVVLMLVARLLLVDQAINVCAKWSIPLLSQYCNKDTLAANKEEFKPTHSAKYHFYHAILDIKDEPIPNYQMRFHKMCE